MINTVPGFMERSAAQDISSAGSERVRNSRDSRGGLFAKERVERFDLQGRDDPGGSGDPGKCEDAVWNICRLCRGIDPARLRVRNRPSGVVRQQQASGTCGVKTKVWAGMGLAEIAQAEFPTND